MTTTLTYQNVEICGAFHVKHLDKFRMEACLNEHAVAYFSGVLDEETQMSQLEKQIKYSTVSVLASEDSQTLFCGIIRDVKISYVNDCYYIEAWLISATYLLDIAEKSRSFQNISLTYEDVIAQILAGTKSAACIMADGLNRNIDVPIIQYLETDWAFAKRLASHFGVWLIPECTMGKPQFWLGMRDNDQSCVFTEDEYSVGVNEKFYESDENYSINFFYYKVKSYQDCSIGTKTIFKEKSLVISEKNCYFEKGIIVFEYTLTLPTFMSQQKQFNEKISGMSILGTVLETREETIKLHLDIDKEQNPMTAYPYHWVPATGNIMYLMPKVGTRVALYFYSDDEASAKAVHCVRTNGGSQCADMGDYNKRYLSTEHQKQMYFFPESMGLVGKSNTDTPLQMQLNDETGIVIQSHKALDIIATEGISIQAPIIQTQALNEMRFMHAVLSVEGDGKNVPYNVVAKPLATIEMAEALLTQLGENTRYAGWKYNAYPPFNDAPTEGKCSFWEVAGKVLAGIAVAVVIGAAVAALTFVTAGAALPVLAAIGINATAAGLAITAGAITAAAGSAAAIKKGIDDSQSGNIGSVIDYLSVSFNSSMRMGATVLTAVNLLSATGSIVAIANGLKGLTIGFAQIAGTNMLVPYMTGGAIALTDVLALTNSIALAYVGFNNLNTNPNNVPLTGQTEEHHMLPKTFKNFFSRVGLDIEDFTYPLDKAVHRLKPGGLHTGSDNWNKVWGDYIARNPSASAAQILEQLEKMLVQFGLK